MCITWLQELAVRSNIPSLSLTNAIYIQEEALRLLDEATDFLSKLMTNNTEEADTLSKEVSQNMLLGLGNILKISSEDASVIKQSFLWGQSDKYKKKVLNRAVQWNP